mgnify:CR=1 FL=1
MMASARVSRSRRVTDGRMAVAITEVGSASAEVEDDVIARLDVDSWRESYTAPGADLIRYTLEIGERTFTPNPER